MSAPINRYKANLRDFHFLLFEQFPLETMLGEGPFAGWGRDECGMVLEEAYRFATEVLGPLNAIGDAQGCRLEDGQVRTPEGFKEAWRRLYEAGWANLGKPPELGGQSAPAMLEVVVGEMLSGANAAFNMYPGLATGASEVIAHFGTPRQRELYLGRMTDGTWGGSMCITEPHAGSDVGASTTTAVPLGDGRYALRGTKTFISGGDCDLVENIIHLVLARIEGARPGTKGLSLFIVPKHRVADDGSLLEPNDITIPSIEHKMGLNGSATCVVQLGDEGSCVGELVGTVEHQGMAQMFRMMNFSRIGVGIQGLGIAGSAYLNALEYAKERRQGTSIAALREPTAERALLIEHPNIRKDLLDMKARVEGIRALLVKLGFHQDRARLLQGKDDAEAAYHQGQVDLLTPLVKAYASDQAFRVCERAIQIYGGAGYLKDHPVEQYCRDAKVFSIYEGTNAIQSLDLVGRKLGQAGGAHTQAFLGSIEKFVQAHAGEEELGEAVAILAEAHRAVSGSVMQLPAWLQRGELARIPLHAETFLQMMSELAIGWLLLEAAVVARSREAALPETHPDRAFYAGKRLAARHFARQTLSLLPALASNLASDELAAVEMPLEAF